MSMMMTTSRPVSLSLSLSLPLSVSLSLVDRFEALEALTSPLFSSLASPKLCPLMNPWANASALVFLLGEFEGFDLSLSPSLALFLPFSALPLPSLGYYTPQLSTVCTHTMSYRLLVRTTLDINWANPNLN